MKKERKKIVVFVIFLSVLLGLTTKNEAVNEINQIEQVNQTNSTKASSNTSNTNNTGNTTNQVAQKSSNANLSNLGIKPYDFTGFKYGTTSYEVAVPEETESVEVYATTQDAKATLTGTGKKNLEKGENKAEVTVTAEDGTTKIYTINIIREIRQENEEEEYLQTEELANGLATLEINNLSLSPEFKTNLYEYTVKYIGEDTKLEIVATPTKEDYIIEVIGNENLKEGENFITLLVSQTNGNNIATYQITVNKSLIDEEAIAKEEAKKKQEQQKVIIGSIVAVIVVIIIVIVVIYRKRTKRIFGDQEQYEEYYEEQEREEVPKALQQNQEKNLEENEIKLESPESHTQRYFLEETEEEEDFEQMPKDKIKEKFLDGYSSNKIGMGFEVESYKSTRIKGKHKGKRFK